MKSITYSLSIVFSCLLFTGFGQNLDIEGTAKVSGLTKDNSADSVVVILDDGTLGVRDVSTIGSSGGASSYIIGGGAANNGFDESANNNFLPMGSSTVRTETFDGAKSRIPQCGTLSAMEGAINDTTDNVTYTFTVYKNDIAQSLSCSISPTNYNCTDLVNSVSFEEGDYISILFKGNDNGMVSENRFGRWIGLYTPSTCPN